MARYAPGLSKSELETMTPEETAYARRAVERHVKDDRELTLILTKAVLKTIASRPTL